MEKAGKGLRPRRQSAVLTVTVELELLRALAARSKELGTDVETFARWCLHTGLYMGDLNAFVRTRMREGS